MGVRALLPTDAVPWSEIRGRSEDWLAPWEATLPPGAGPGAKTFRSLIRRLRWQADLGRMLPCTITYDDVFVGQVTVGNILRGSAQSAQCGYWIDETYAGRAVTPIAVAMVIDHCFTGMGLHRMEIAIRTENHASLRVVEKLGIAEYGFAPRYLHIDDDWRDHRLFAITAEEVPEGLLNRFLG